mmetsp:Transcript_21970/g.68182  ORF Transcript_21970/g.68182 Transcript_21970/m.68182 type:complete len:232 (+) Transcript_21970:1260-1955(+)
MEVPQRRAHLPGVRHELRGVHRADFAAAVFRHRPQRSALGVLHDQVHFAVRGVVDHLVQLDHVGVPKSNHVVHFAMETLGRSRARLRAPDDLDRALGPGAHVHSEHDAPLLPFPERVREHVVVDGAERVVLVRVRGLLHVWLLHVLLGFGRRQRGLRGACVGAEALRIPHAETLRARKAVRGGFRELSLKGRVFRRGGAQTELSLHGGRRRGGFIRRALGERRLEGRLQRR